MSPPTAYIKTKNVSSINYVKHLCILEIHSKSRQKRKEIEVKKIVW
jgi:hypothetical protein